MWLLGAGLILLLLTGLFIWFHFQPRGSRRNRPKRRSVRPVDPVLHPAANEEEAEVELEPMPPRAPEPELGPEEELPAQPELPFGAGREGSGTSADKAEEEWVIVLHVASTGEYLEGETLAPAFAEVGLVHGPMSIFHHYGVGELESDQPLFSVANMVEPGTFEPEAMARLRTPGVALFMRVPAPREPRLVFELMLNTAERLAGRLSGQLLDEHREPLTAAAVERIRQRLEAELR